MKRLVCVFLLSVLLMISSTGCNSSGLSNDNFSETVKPTEFKYIVDETYTFGDIEFSCSSILNLEDDEDGGTFRCDDPYIYLSNYRMHSMESVKLSSLHYIPEDAIDCNSKEFYIKGCPAYKYSYAEPGEYHDTYASTLSFIYNAYTYTFICITDLENKDLCEKVIKSIENSLVFVESETESPTEPPTDPPTERPTEAPYGTASNPTPLGKTATLTMYDGTVLEMSIDNIISGDEAWNMIYGYNSLNDLPSDGYHYVLFDVNVKCVATDDEDGYRVRKKNFCAANESKAVLNDTDPFGIVLADELDVTLYSDSYAHGKSAVFMPNGENGYIVFSGKYFFSLS